MSYVEPRSPEENLEIIKLDEEEKRLQQQIDELNSPGFNRAKFPDSEIPVMVEDLEAGEQEANGATEGQ